MQVLRLASFGLLLASGCARGIDDFPVYNHPFRDAGNQGTGDGGLGEEPDPWGEDDASSDPGPQDPTADAGEDEDPDEPDASEPAPTCLPGTYDGTFEGTITLLGVIPLPINGQIAIHVESNATGDRLTIDNGSISGEDQDGNTVKADVTGTLNCATNKLENGTLANGEYKRKSLGTTVKFTGVVTANYMPGEKPTMAGTWKTDGGAFENGEGTFQAKFANP